MKPISILRLAAASLLIAMVPSTPARAAPSTSDLTAGGKTDEPVKLDPFSVQADSDQSYGALNSNSITGFNTELSKMPLSADILDETFMKDVGGNDPNLMLQAYVGGAGASSIDPGSGAGATQPGDRGVFYTLRGLSAPTEQRDALLPYQPPGSGVNSNFDLERIEIVSGPQSLLYGNVGAGGVINYVSKQARFGKPANGSFEFQLDQYGHKLGLVDVGAGGEHFALRADVFDQTVGMHRVNIGGPLQGYYVQAAGRYGNTTVRLDTERTRYNRDESLAFTLAAPSTASDARNGQNLAWLIASNQVNASATGASSAGPIDNGHLNWDNANSWGGQMYSDIRTVDYDSADVDSVWTSWFSTKLSTAYSYTHNPVVRPTLAFYSPNNTANPLGTWAVGSTGTRAAKDQLQEAWLHGARLQALFTNDLFGGRAHSQTIVGADTSLQVNNDIDYEWVQADSNFNPVITAGVTSNNGRTSLPAQYWSIANGPVQYPIFDPYSNRITQNGVNYVRVLSNTINPALISPSDPIGASENATDTYSYTHRVNKGEYAVNYTEWFDGRIDTLLGVRRTENYFVSNAGLGNVNSLTDATNTTFEGGVVWKMTSWLSPYASASTGYNPPVNLINDPDGGLPRISHSVGGEAGVKLTDPQGRISGSIAVYSVRSTDEQLQVNAALVTDINPSGLNGTFGAPSSYVYLNRQSEGVQLSLTAAPIPNWRARFSAAWTDGTVQNNVTFGQLYNDQFHENSAGDVTYADGTLVYVNPAYNSKQLTVASTVAGAVPLTVGMLASPTSPYFANPVAINGQISSSSAAANVLHVVDPTHGAILTGATGLPISAQQVNPGFTPPGTIVIAHSGDGLVGTPQFNLNMTNVYTFTSGLARGFRVGGTVSLGWKIKDYYYQTSIDPSSQREILMLPTIARFDLILGYEWKLKRLSWSTQLNVQNMFNHYHIILLPNEVAGWSGPNNATFDQQPRLLLWSTTLSF